MYFQDYEPKKFIMNSCVLLRYRIVTHKATMLLSELHGAQMPHDFPFKIIWNHGIILDGALGLYMWGYGKNIFKYLLKKASFKQSPRRKS